MNMTGWMQRLGLVPQSAAPRASRQQREAYRIASARHHFPAALTLGAVILVVLGLVFRAETAESVAWAGLSFFISAGVLLVYGLLVPRLTDRVLLWSYGVVMALALAPQIARAAITGSAALIGFSAVLSMMLVALAVSWKPVLVGFVLLVVFDQTVITRIDGPTPSDPMDVVLVASQLFAAGLLVARIQMLNHLADTTVLAEQVATEDSLTGLLNRRGLDIGVAALEGNARRSGAPILVAYVDVDGLKAVNDTFGHEEGDQVIAAVGRALRESARVGDLVARVGGDEFVIVGVGGLVEGGALATRLSDSIEAHYPVRDKWAAKVTVGMASADARSRSVADLMLEADTRMYDERRRTRGDEAPSVDVRDAGDA